MHQWRGRWDFINLVHPLSSMDKHKRPLVRVFFNKKDVRYINCQDISSIPKKKLRFFIRNGASNKTRN